MSGQCLAGTQPVQLLWRRSRPFVQLLSQRWGTLAQVSRRLIALINLPVIVKETLATVTWFIWCLLRLETLHAALACHTCAKGDIAMQGW